MYTYFFIKKFHKSNITIENRGIVFKNFIHYER